MLDEWRRNVRLRLLVYLALAIAWAYGLSLLTEKNRMLTRQLADDSIHIQRLQPSAKPALWHERQADSRQKLLAAVAGTWSEKSGSQAVSVFRDWIVNTANNSGAKVKALSVTHHMANDKVKADQAVIDKDAASLPQGYGVLMAQLEVSFSPVVLIGLLDRFANEPRKIALNRLLVKNPMQGNGSVEMEFRAVLKTSLPENKQ